jgi:hypothetical protein
VDVCLFISLLVLDWFHFHSNVIIINDALF